jgi:ATP-binding cassette subfamily C protein CydC
MRPLLRILAIFRPHAGYLITGLVLSLAALGAALALVTLSGATVAAIATGGFLAAPLLLRIAGPARVVLRYLERLITHGATFRALADLRVWFFRGLANSSAGGLGFRRAGDLLSSLVADVEALDGLYLRILIPLAGAILVIPAAGILAGRLNLWLGASVALLFALAAFAMPVFAARASMRAGDRLAHATANLRIAALDALTGLREVRAYGAEARMKTRVAGAEAGLLGAQASVASSAARANAAAFLCGQGAVLAILLTAVAARPQPALLVAAAFLAIGGFETLSGLPRAGVSLGTAAAAARRVLLTATAGPAYPDPAVSREAPSARSLRFRGIDFAWSADAPPVFSGMTLDIPAGARIAVLGPSGSGKSTLAALALRLVSPQAGEILLGDTDIALLTAACLHRRITYLSQATHLFDDTIRHNLLLGRPGATDLDLWEALDRAAIGDTVRALPEGLDSWLGEGGARLSGGQGRRVALARALLSDAPILILDEPCAGLDAETERAFLTTLFAEVAGRTLILITHRLTGVEKLDRIWRLSAGHAVAAAA